MGGHAYETTYEIIYDGQCDIKGVCHMYGILCVRAYVFGHVCTWEGL